jgi:hypothetical protein
MGSKSSTMAKVVASSATTNKKQYPEVGKTITNISLRNQNASIVNRELDDDDSNLISSMRSMPDIKTSFQFRDHVNELGKNQAVMIRIENERLKEENKKKGIVVGRKQMREHELMVLLTEYRDGSNDSDNGVQISKVCKELNITIQEALELVRSVQIPILVRKSGDDTDSIVLNN